MNETTYDGHLHILELDEIEQLYGLPDFDSENRMVFFNLSPEEMTLMKESRGVSSKVYFILQLGYFKAKRLFFNFDFKERKVDGAFVLKKYFPTTNRNDLIKVSRPTRQNQQRQIAAFFQYQRFDKTIQNEVFQHAISLTKRHNHPVYLFRSLFEYLSHLKIILPSYSLLQRQIISKAIQQEQHRLEQIITQQIKDSEKDLIKALLEKTEKEMYPFTLLQKEPSSFDYYQIRRLLERQKILAPIYVTALRLCKQMKIANENIRYYGNMAMEYKVFNLKRMLENSNLPYVYLLCFAHNRYRIGNDILIEALRFHVLGLEKSTEKAVQQQLYDYQLAAHQSLAKVPKILALFQDQAMDEHVFEVVKKIAFDILSPEEFDLVIELIGKTR
jgi:hypothetical protein